MTGLRSAHQLPRRLQAIVSARGLLSIAALTLAWCGLWRDVSVANVFSGIAVSVFTLALGIGSPRAGGIRMRPLLRLIVLVVVDLVQSTFEVAREILTIADNTDEEIIHIELDENARRHTLLLVVAVTLTPGTAVLDADVKSGVLAVHLLHSEQAESARDHINQLVLLANEAFPSIDPHPNRPDGGKQGRQVSSC